MARVKPKQKSLRGEMRARKKRQARIVGDQSIYGYDLWVPTTSARYLNHAIPREIRGLFNTFTGGYIYDLVNKQIIRSLHSNGA